MTGPERRSPVMLLAAQGAALGLVGGFVIIPASGIFLSHYGSKGLPWVYLLVDGSAALTTPAIGFALRRWALPSVAIAVLAMEAAVIGAAWIGLELANASWLSVLLEVLFPLVLQVGFMFIGAQAGRLLTVREMKERFPRIVSGFVVGFLIAGLLGPPLLAVLDATERLLGVACAFALAQLGLVLATRHRFAAQLALTDVAHDDMPITPMRKLMSGPLVKLLLVYQVLSMLGTQLVDFLVFDRAAARYATSNELARFTSVFTIALNAVDLLFLGLVAGLLLRRFGMRLGLVANPAAVTVFVVLGLITGGALGVGSLLMFFAVGAARTSDVALTDGATRTAINTAYQALPPADRLAVQANVEGIGVPGAIGLAGVVLLIVQRVFHGETMAVVVVTIVAGALWTLSGSAVYRQYQVSLRDNLRRRVLQPTQLIVDDEATEVVVQRLLEGDEPGVDLAFELIIAQSDAARRLREIVTNEPAGPTTSGAHRGGVRAQALDRLVRADPSAAVQLAATLTADRDPELRAMAARALADAALDANGGADPALSDRDPVVRLAAMRSHVRRGGVADTRMHDDVRLLLAAGDLDVQAAAHRTAALIGGDDMLGLVVAALGSARTASIAQSALSGMTTGLAPVLDAALSDAALVSAAAPTACTVRLVRCAARSADPLVAAVLGRHARHPSRDLALDVLRALVKLRATGGTGATGAGSAPVENFTVLAASIIGDDGEHAARCLRAADAIAAFDDAVAQELLSALGDELRLLRRRALACLGLTMDVAMLAAAGAWLDDGDARRAALALETLDVSVPRDIRGIVIPILQSGNDEPGALRALSRLEATTPSMTSFDSVLQDLVVDSSAVWRRAWLQVCGLHLAVTLRRPNAADLVRAAASSADPLVREVAAWSSAGAPSSN